MNNKTKAKFDLVALCNIVACTLAEVGEASEGHLYAGLMNAGINLDDFRRIKSLIIHLGLATSEPGYVLKATPRLKQVYGLAKKDGEAKP